jgi:ribosomal peptide maturation radical SAM protein 1
MSAADIVLVNMPFATLNAPSIGLSLVKSALRTYPITVRERYYNISFAQTIGVGLYEHIAGSAPDLLVGEWIFAKAAFGSELRSGYYETFLDIPARGRESTPEALTHEALLALQRTAEEFVDSCCTAILADPPQIVAFTSTFQQNVASLALAERLKRANPDVLILFGGANCEGVMGATLKERFAFIDCVVSGEADLIVGDLVNAALDAGRFAKPALGVFAERPVDAATIGVAERIEGLDVLPFVDYDEFFKNYGTLVDAEKKPPRALFETSRGCWWGEKNHCTFCGLNGSSMAFRSKSAERAERELLDMMERYPTAEISVVDNILDMHYFKDFLPDVAAWETKPNLFYEVKANLKKDQVKLLKQAGVTAIQPGIESLCGTTLKLMKKGISPLQNIQLLKWCQQYRIAAYWNVLWGFPGEVPDEYAHAAEMVQLLSHLEPPVSCSKVRLDRFSPNFDDSDILGFINVRPAAAYQYVYPLQTGELANLAHYFDYETAQPYTQSSYVAALDSAIQIWRTSHDASEFVSTNLNGRLILLDSR